MDFDQRTQSIGWMRAFTDTTIDPRGRDVLVVIAKLAFSVGFDGRARVAPVDPFRSALHDPGGGVLRPPDFEADWKPGTDVGLVGTAHFPRGPGAAPRTSLAWLRVGTLRKAIKIFGPRVYAARWGDPVLSDPAPLVAPVPLRWDLAWGGRDGHSGAHEPHNPIGRGFASTPTQLDGQLGPQLEPADDAASSSSEVAHRSHGTFAPIPPNWEPRRARAGTHDTQWAQERAPVRPTDFDPRHFSWAAPGLWSATSLTSDAAVEVGGVLEEGTWRFALPKYDVGFRTILGGEEREHESHLDGFLIDADARRVELTWRARVLLPKKWELIDGIVVTGKGDLPEDGRLSRTKAA